MGIVDSIGDYIVKDAQHIYLNELSMEELERLRRSGLGHQAFLAPACIFTIAATIAGVDAHNHSAALLSGIASLPLYSMYLRYLFRTVSASTEIKRAKKSSLERMAGA